ncbi:hypothetical protein Fmac_005407 [Flemingia macrophylla]|uniref:valine--tRNA ligase n=1 Tax=Flemingia macrophylla TaxID=520843 RepID=A0ABD1N7P1_9FABA
MDERRSKAVTEAFGPSFSELGLCVASRNISILRYRHFHGKHAIHPFNERKLPIICDAILVDPKFGTGVVKGLYRGSENNEMRLGVCSRSNDVVEPMIKPQWYVNCKDLAKQALQAVVDEENIRLEIVPKQYMADWKRGFWKKLE